MTQIETQSPKLCELYGIDAAKEREAYNRGLADFVAGKQDTLEARYWKTYDIYSRLGEIVLEPLAE